MPESRLAENLRYLREINEYRQEDVSARINVARQTYSTYENGKRTPCVDTLRCLAKLYGISMDALVDSDLSQSLISEPGSYRHFAETPQDSRIALSGADAKMLMDYKSLPAEDRAEIREYVRFKKQRVKKSS